MERRHSITMLACFLAHAVTAQCQSCDCPLELELAGPGVFASCISVSLAGGCGLEGTQSVPPSSTCSGGRREG